MQNCSALAKEMNLQQKKSVAKWAIYDYKNFLPGL